jgi:hypothetical protein
LDRPEDRLPSRTDIDDETRSKIVDNLVSDL